MHKKRFLGLIAIIGMSAGLLFSCSNPASSSQSGDTDKVDTVYEVYQLAKEAGYTGSYEDWIAALKKDTGDTGLSFLSGTGAPAATLGNSGDTYLDTSGYDLYLGNRWLGQGRQHQGSKRYSWH
jgi:hypothetical protein